MKIFCFCYACHPASSSCFIYQFGCTWPCLFHLENLLVQKQQLGTHPTHSPEQNSQMTPKVCPSVCFAYCLSKKGGGNSVRFTSPPQKTYRRKSLWVLSSLPLLLCGSFWPDHPVSFLPAVLTLMENKLIWGEKNTLEKQGKSHSLYKFLSCWGKCEMKTSPLQSWGGAKHSVSSPCPAPCSDCGVIWGALPQHRPDNVGTQRSCGCTSQPYPEEPSHCCQMFTRGLGVPSGSLQGLACIFILFSWEQEEIPSYPNSPKLLRSAGLALPSSLDL